MEFCSLVDAMTFLLFHIKNVRIGWGSNYNTSCGVFREKITRMLGYLTAAIRIQAEFIPSTLKCHYSKYSSEKSYQFQQMLK